MKRETRGVQRGGKSARIEVFLDSCTSLARAHCFHIITITFAALHLDVNTFARSAKELVAAVVSFSVILDT